MKKLNTRLANFNKKIVGKKLIIFGTGPTAKELMGKLKLPISYLVDNDKNNWDQSIDGYKVFNPKNPNPSNDVIFLNGRQIRIPREKLCILVG